MMRRYLIIIFYVFATTFISNLYAQNKIILSKDNAKAHIKLPGTTTVSGPNAVVYGYKDYLRQTKDPYTFYNELFISYGFESYNKGRGRILNVTGKTARVQVTCIDGQGLANNTLIIEIAPRTFSRIMFQNYDNMTHGIVNKIKCELIKLY